MSGHGEKPYFVMKRRSSPASLPGGSLLDCGPFTHPTFTSGYEGEQHSASAYTGSTLRRRQPPGMSPSQQPSQNFRQHKNWPNTPPGNFSTFRQSRAAMSPLSERSDTDDSFRSSASNSSTPCRSHRYMDISDEPEHRHSRSPARVSDVFDQFSNAMRISQKSPERVHSKMAPQAQHSGANEPSNLLKCENSLVEIKHVLQRLKKSSGSPEGVKSSPFELRKRPQNTSPSRTDHRRSFLSRRKKSPDEGHHPKRGCCEQACTFLFTMLMVAAIVAACGLAIRNLTQSACVENQRLDVGRLTASLQKRVYGQHIAVNDLPHILNQHVAASSNSPLVLAFHGWTGIGKNFVSQMISRQVAPSARHLVLIHMDYLPGDGDHSHRDEIITLIHNGTRPCALNLFIMDELDKASTPFTEGLVDVIQKLKAKPINNTKTLILLLSNSGGGSINQFVFDHLQTGQRRENIKSHDLEPLVLTALETAGDPSVSLYKAGLVDHIIPFMPLEARHVKGCIRDYLQQNGSLVTSGSKMDALFDKVLEQITFFPKGTPLFSKTGCRKVPVKVDLALG